MEHREVPRIVSADGRPRDARAEPGTDRHRFARFVSSPHERRLVRSRLGLALVTGVFGLIAVGLVGTHVVEKTVQWLHGRPQYQTSFGAIELEPLPPKWYHGGAPVLLERVRRAAERDDGLFSFLDIDLAELGREFRLYGWVKEVRFVRRRAPNRLIVSLEYRKPVAWTDVPGRKGRVLLDDEAVILPIEDIDESKAPRLVRLIGLDPPFRPVAGQTWRIEEDTNGVGRADPGARAAARLAGFFADALVREPTPVAPTLRPVAIHLVEKRFLFVQNEEQTMILWTEVLGHAPGPALERSDEQKWADLHDWLERRSPEPVGGTNYLTFDKDGVVRKKGQK